MRPWYTFIRGTVRLLFNLFYRHKVYGAKKPVYGGGAILAANHVSHLDPEIVGVSWPHEIHYLARETLFKNRFFSWLIRSLNAHPVARGEADLGAVRLIMRLLKEGRQVVIFPEGTRSEDGEIQEAEGGMASFALRTDCAIIPTYVAGTYDVWPKGRKGPKLFGRTGCIFGQPIHASEYAHLPKKEAQEQLSLRVMSEMRALKLEYQRLRPR